MASIGITAIAKSQLQTALHLGLLNESSRIRLEAEVCTAQRPSMTLRGSSKKYREKFDDLVTAVDTAATVPSDKQEGPIIDGKFSVLRFCAVTDSENATRERRRGEKADEGSVPRFGAFEVCLSLVILISSEAGLCCA